MSRRTTIGFDRRIDLEWLDAAAGYAAAGASIDEIRVHLWTVLDGVVTGDKSNSARGKTVTVLNHIWGDVPESARSLRERAIRLLDDSTPDDRLALHWAMMVGTYPVFTDAAEIIGRLLILQGDFSLAHLTRRLVSVWGERSTVERAGQRIVRSMIQWRVLKDTATRGLYVAVPRKRNIQPAVSAVLMEALLLGGEEASIPLEQMIRHPAVFPFELTINASQIREMPQLQVHRQGLDSDFVELRR